MKKLIYPTPRYAGHGMFITVSKINFNEEEPYMYLPWYQKDSVSFDSVASLILISFLFVQPHSQSVPPLVHQMKKQESFIEPLPLIKSLK